MIERTKMLKFMPKQSLILLCLVYNSLSISECSPETFYELVTDYKVKTHKIITDDGFILTAFRIQSLNGSDPTQGMNKDLEPILL